MKKNKECCNDDDRRDWDNDLVTRKELYLIIRRYLRMGVLWVSALIVVILGKILIDWYLEVFVLMSTIIGVLVLLFILVVAIGIVAFIPELIYSKTMVAPVTKKERRRS